MRSEEEEQSLKPDLRQPWICIASNFIFLALAYYETVAVLSHRVSSSHRLHCTFTVLIIAHRGCRWSRNLNPNFCPGGWGKPEQNLTGCGQQLFLLVRLIM